jgi:hypothetical protein
MVNFCAVCGCCTRTENVREHLEDTLRICDVSAMGLYIHFLSSSLFIDVIFQIRLWGLDWISSSRNFIKSEAMSRTGSKCEDLKSNPVRIGGFEMTTHTNKSLLKVRWINFKHTLNCVSGLDVEKHQRIFHRPHHCKIYRGEISGVYVKVYYRDGFLY